MDHAHHVDLDRAVQPKLLGDSRHLASRQHNPQPQKHIVVERQQAQEKECCLEELSQAQGDNLLAPLAEPVRITLRDREAIEGANRHLYQENAPSFYVREEPDPLSRQLY